jgi:hypothetical protein
MQAVSGEVAKQRRQLNKTKVHWRTYYIGKGAKTVEDRPHAELVEMTPNEVIRPHFHQVDQFQVLVAGSGSLGRNAVPLLTLHYADRHTAYGPITAGPFGLSFFTIRSKGDPGAIWLHKPDHKDHMRPSKKRYLLSENIGLSTAPVLENRGEISLENVLKEADGNDGLGAYMLRMGGSKKTTGPDPRATGAQYYLVVNGSMQLDNAEYPAWSTIHVSPAEGPIEVCSGARGLEALVLHFPIPDA